MKLGKEIAFDIRHTAIAGDVTLGYHLLMLPLGRLAKINIVQLDCSNLTRGFTYAQVGYTRPQSDAAQGLLRNLAVGLLGGVYTRLVFTGPLEVVADGLFAYNDNVALNDVFEVVGSYREVLNEE